MSVTVARPASPHLPGTALLAKGFRPFFLCAAAYAVISLPLLLLVLSGHVTPSAYLTPLAWHAHEMVFGFAAAVLGGFLLTAVENWTQRATVAGASLAALVAVWVAGRVVMLLPAGLPRYLPALVDLAFVPALLLACARPLLAARNRRNYGFLALLAGLWAANGCVHAAALGLAPFDYQSRGSWLGVDLLVVALVVVSGRVVPMFTRNTLGSPAIRSVPTLERLAMASVVLLVVLEALVPFSRALGSAAILAAAFTALRMHTWGTLRTFREPLLWILHLGSAWITLGLVLRGAASFTSLPVSSGLHAVTAGAIGALTLGMMTRVTLGHTGRKLAVPWHITLAFGLIGLAALARVLAPLTWPGSLTPLVLAGGMWSAAFAIYLLTYAPTLWVPRPDGRAG
jgi:uncharacterized protein involved in response to NO